MSRSDMSREVEAVLDWHRAVNDGDVSGLAGLVADDVQLEGFAIEGSAGRDGLGRWVEATRVQLAPKRLYRRGETVVAEQAAVWWSQDPGQPSQPAQAGMVFELADGSITRIVRYPDAARALEASGLEDTDMELDRVP